MEKNKDISVIICCAGLGSNLNLDITKTLMSINDKPIILHLLSLLDDFDDIRIVVGYQAKKVINVVNEYRKDIMWVFNHKYATTGPGDSFELSLKGARKKVISIDGDLFLKRSDFDKIMSHKNDCIAITKTKSEKPLMIQIEKDKIIDIDKESKYQWAGVLKINIERLKHKNTDICKMIDSNNLDIVKIDTFGIDTLNDYNEIKKILEDE